MFRLSITLCNFQFSIILDKIAKEARKRGDLNVVVVSDHGMSDVANENMRFLEDYLDMKLVHITLGCGAIKHIVPVSGMVHNVAADLMGISPSSRKSFQYFCRFFDVFEGRNPFRTSGSTTLLKQ